VISIQTVVYVVLFLLGAGAIFGLLLYLVQYLEREFPGFGLFFRAARIALVVLAVLVLIGLVLHLMGAPVVMWR
jgi:hypothetical protein